MFNYIFNMHVFTARFTLLVAIGVLTMLTAGHAHQFPFMERPTCQGEDTKEIVVQIARRIGLIHQARVAHNTSFDPNRENDIWFHIDHIRTRQTLSSSGAKLCSARLTVTHRGEMRVSKNLIYAVGKDDQGELAIALM